MVPRQTSLPSSSLGYWRGTPGLSGPSTPSTQGGAPVPTQGTSGLSMGTGSVTIGGTEWHPSVLYLLALIIAEMVGFHILGRILK
jgi:hypothetical protein